MIQTFVPIHPSALGTKPTFMDYLSPGTMFFSSVAIVIPGIISNKCWRDLLVMKQFSLLEIISTATVLLAVVVESSRVFHVVG